MGKKQSWGRRSSDNQAYPKDIPEKDSLPRGLTPVKGARHKGMDMTISLDEAKYLRIGTILHHRAYKNADGTPQRWKVTGRVQRWKRDDDRIKVPIKRGLYEHDYLTKSNLDDYRFPAGS